MKKNLLFRTWMLAALMLVGLSSVQAQTDNYRWDFTTWAASDLQSADKLHGLTWTGNVGIANGGFRLTNGSELSIPVSTGQSVQILFKSNGGSDGTRRTDVAVGGATNVQTARSLNPDNIVTITANATGDGVITFRYTGGNGGLPVITTIKRDNNVDIVNHWDFSSSNNTDGLYTNAINYRSLADGMNGYQLGEGGYIVVPVSQGQIVTFDVESLDGRYQASYVISDQTDGAGPFSGVYGEVVSKYFQANANGFIKIERGERNPAMSGVRAITIENAPNIAFDRKTCSANLVELNIDEPTLSYPTGAQITYSVENTNVAKLGGEAGIGDLMGINTGVTNVYASVVYKGITYTDSYQLTLWADEAKYTITDGITYTLTGNGKLANRVVTEIPKITMEFGSNDVVNTTIVRNEGNVQSVGTILDSNGWRQLWATFENGLVHPHQGSFYTFKPKSNGQLTINGYLNNTSQTAYLVDSENLAPLSSNFTGSVGITNNNWQGASGMANWAGPEITTADGRVTRLAEKFEGTLDTTGELMTQTISGLDNGHYVVKLYANAASTHERDGYLGQNDMQDGAMDVAYVFANGTTQYIPAYISTQANEVAVYSLDVTVTDGSLKMGIGKSKRGTNWHMIQIADLEKTDVPASYTFNPVATISTGDVSAMQTTVVNVQAGHTYYLYGNVPSTNNGAWSTYEFKSFTFEPSFRYETKSILLAHDATEGGQQVIGAGPTEPTFEMELLGDIESATLNADGTVSNIVLKDEKGGGAIVVKATIGSGDYVDQIYYVMTIPYVKHTWDFKGNEYDEEAQGLNKDMDWGVTYEVRTYDEVTRELTYLNNPVLTANEELDGNNAAYIGETAGLWVDADIKTFGLCASGDNLKDVDVYNEYFGTSYSAEEFADSLENAPAFVDALLRTMLSYKLEDIHENSTNLGAMKNGAVMTIPSLKKGTYVAIKTYRHSPNTGDEIHVTNVTDLDGAPVTTNLMTIVQSTNQGRDLYNAIYGWLEFIVAEDGDVTFNVVDQKGWTHIKQIAVSDEFIDTNLLLADEGVVGKGTVLFSHKKGEGLTHKYDSNWSGAYCHQEAWHYVKYSLEDAEGTFTIASSGNGAKARKANGQRGTISITEDGQLNVSDGHGTVYVVQKVYSRTQSKPAADYIDLGPYVIDMERTKITIIEGGETTQEYPYTWDFTNISDETKQKLTQDSEWDNTDGTYTPNRAGQETYVQNTELENGNDDDVKEFDGLGFITSTDDEGYSTGISNIGIDTDGSDSGLKIGGNETTKIVVPDVPQGCTVYVRVEPNDNSEIGHNGEQLTETFTEGSEKVYEIPVEIDEEDPESKTETDVIIELKDVNVKGIAVTNIFKEARMASASETDKFYNTDCQAKDIDYSLTDYYTGHDMKAMFVKADGISEVNTKRETAVVTGIEVTKPVAANTGLIVYTDENETLFPLFVPGVNATERENTEGNMLVGVVYDESKGASKSTETLYKYEVKDNGKSVDKVKTEVIIYTGGVTPAEGETYRYLFTNQFNQVGMDDNTIDADEPAFYRLKANGGKLKSNRAYLVLDQSVLTGTNGIKTIYLHGFTDDGELDEPTAIELVKDANMDIDVNGTFYTLSGMKIQGLPKTSGIYIQNGKKIMIK